MGIIKTFDSLEEAFEIEIKEEEAESLLTFSLLRMYKYYSHLLVSYIPQLNESPLSPLSTYFGTHHTYREAVD